MRRAGRAGLLSGLQINIEVQGRGVTQDDRQPVEGLLGRLGLAVPDRCQRIANVALVDLLNRNSAQLRQHMQRERREPAAGHAIALELSLARLKGVLRQRCKPMLRAGGLAAQPLALLDRIHALSRHLPPPRRGHAGLLE